MAEIKIAATSGGGSTSLKGAASTSENSVFVLPNADGSAGQYLKTDGNKNLGWGTDQGGKILQVKSASQKDKQSTTADTTGASDALKFHTWGTLITGLSISITPADNNNKILIMYDVALHSSTRYSGIGISRTPSGGTEVMTAVGDQDGSTRRRVAKMCPGNPSAGSYTDYEGGFTLSGTYLDDPQSSVALTYKVYFGNIADNSGAHTTYVNTNSQQTSQDQDWSSSAISTLTLMDVSV